MDYNEQWAVVERLRNRGIEPTWEDIFNCFDSNDTEEFLEFMCDENNLDYMNEEDSDDEDEDE